MSKENKIEDYVGRRTWAEININNVEQNYIKIKKHAHSKICCVVKANAYGHNAIVLSSLYQSLGADYLAVSNIEEAIQLRKNKITIPILILGYTPPECASLLYQYDLTQTVYSLDYGRELLQYASCGNYQIKIHIKIDSGMGRIGFATNKACLDEIVALFKERTFIPEGIFTHFAEADAGKNGKEYTMLQYKKFKDFVLNLQDKGLFFEIVHCSNSAAILEHPEFHFDMIRAGIILYGLYPSELVSKTLDLLKVMALKSVISHIKHIAPGDSISYGRTFIASSDMKIATVPIGYADGLWRNNGNMKYSLKVNGQYAPIVGRICMDQLMIDVTNIQCAIGDEVLVFGDDERCSADALAKVNNTINYEIVCAVGERVPRLFLRSGKVVGYIDSLL